MRLLPLAYLCAAAMFAQSAPPARFEVAAIHPSDIRPREAARAGRFIGMKIDGGRVDIGLYPLTGLIAIAYGVDANHVSGPDWMAVQPFDVQAKFPEGATKEQLPDMLRALLEERFRLKAHGEKREAEVYALAIGLDGPNMKTAAQDAGKSARPMTAGPGRRLTMYVFRSDPGGANTISLLNGRQVFEGEAVSMAELARALQLYVDRELIDMTGLTGRYEIALEVPKNVVNAGRLALPRGGDRLCGGRFGGEDAAGKLIVARGGCLEKIQKRVNHHAGDADVEPYGQGPAGDGAVADEVAHPGAAQSDYGEKRDGGGERGVGDENGEVDGADGAGAREMNRANLRVVDDVADEEETRSAERRGHHAVVQLNLFAADERVSAGEQHGGGGVERCVDGGQDGNHVRSAASRRMSRMRRGMKPSSSLL